jgi:hypothetical protein
MNLGRSIVNEVGAAAEEADRLFLCFTSLSEVEEVPKVIEIQFISLSEVEGSTKVKETRFTSLSGCPPSSHH